MSRRLRPYVPGGFFHITARTQGRVHWFDQPFVRDRIVEFIAKAVEETDVDLLAYVVMSNHIHLIVRQHHKPLARLMQSLLRRCALLVHRVHGVTGHVFERPYWDKLCADADNLRMWIRYLHRNPLAAQACVSLADYAWSSHHCWARVLDQTPLNRPRLLVARDVFALGANRTSEEVCADYNAFITAELPELKGSLGRYGDVVWEELYSLASYQPRDHPSVRRDLSNIIACGISELCPDLDIELVRTFGGARMTIIRRRLVERAGMAGHRGCKIAEYLHMSEASVSRIVRRLPIGRAGESPITR